MKYRIVELRKSRGMSQVELCEKAGLTRATIWRLETGEAENTTTQTLTKIADALGVPIDELFLPPDV